MIDFGALPPEVNSARMYAGAGSGPMLAAAAAWNGLAAELQSAASSYGSVTSELTGGSWLGPSSMAMAAAVAPYVAWMSATGGQAELAATQAHAAAGAYEAAFAMTVPPPVVAANRAQLMMLVATNVLGQNTPAIAANEAHYAEMWAQDATAMYGYAANSAATTANATPFTAAPQTTNPAGLAAQGAASAQAVGTSTGAGVQSTLSHLVSTVPTTLQSLASPSGSTSGLSGILNGLLGGSSSGSSPTGLGLGGLSSTSSGFMQNLALEGIDLAGFFGIFMAIGPLQAVEGMAIGTAMTPAASLADVESAAEGALGAEAAEGALGSEFAGGFGGFPDVGGLAGLGEAASVGGLSVPPSWAWAATAPEALLGGTPLALPPLALPPLASPLGAAGGLPLAAGLPLMVGGLPGVAAARAGGTAAAKYGPPRTVVARPPAAGYPPVPVSPPMPAYPIPAGLPPPAPGYRPAIVYLPTNGHEPATV